MKLSRIFIVFFLCTIIYGCRKEAGHTGKKIITGVVLYKNGATGKNEPAPSAIVYITYGVKTFTGAYDLSIIADSNGKYTIKGLRKGDYFISAEYTDEHGFKYTSNGYTVEIKNKKEELVLDILLQ